MTAYGVAFILFMRGHVLLQLRDNKPGIGNPFRWALPSGAIDPGEDPKKAARRELAEEYPNLDVCLYELGATTDGTALFYGEIPDHQPMLVCREGCAWGMFKPEAIATYIELASGLPGGVGGIMARRFGQPENFQAFKRLIELNQPMNARVLEPLDAVPVA